MSTSIGLCLDPSFVEEGEDGRRRFVAEVLEFSPPEYLLPDFAPRCPRDGRPLAERESNDFLAYDPLGIGVLDLTASLVSISLSSLKVSIDSANVLSVYTISTRDYDISLPRKRRTLRFP